MVAGRHATTVAGVRVDPRISGLPALHGVAVTGTRAVRCLRFDPGTASVSTRVAL